MYIVSVFSAAVDEVLLGEADQLAGGAVVHGLEAEIVLSVLTGYGIITSRAPVVEKLQQEPHWP